MRVKLLKLSPTKNEKNLGAIAFGDFWIEAYGFEFKLKGCVVANKKSLRIELPQRKPLDREGYYSPFIFSRKEDHAQFVTLCRNEVMEKWPPAMWQKGIYSVLNQGLRDKQKL